MAGQRPGLPRSLILLVRTCFFAVTHLIVKLVEKYLDKKKAGRQIINPEALTCFSICPYMIILKVSLPFDSSYFNKLNLIIVLVRPADARLGGEN